MLEKPTLPPTGELYQIPRSLHDQLVENYFDDRLHHDYRVESRFLASIGTSLTDSLGSFASDMSVSVPPTHRQLLRTAQELGIEDASGFSRLRLGNYATSKGEVSVADIGNHSGRVKAVKLLLDDPEAMAEPLSGRLAGDALVEGLATALRQGQMSYMSSESVRFEDDPALFGSLISASKGSRRDTWSKSPVAMNYEFIESLYAGLEPIMPGESSLATSDNSRPGIYYNEHNQVEKIVLNGSNSTALHYVFEPIDPAQSSLTQGAYRLGYVINQAEYATEPSDNHIAEAPPFILTEDGVALCAEFERLGLRPTEQLRDTLVGKRSTRHGHSYSYLMRELCDVVNDGSNQKLLTLFDADNLDSIVESLRQITVNDLTPIGTGVALTLLRSIANRTQESALPVAGNASSVYLQGLCKDTEFYYAFSSGTHDLETISVDDVSLLKKQYGTHTYMLRTPTMFNGVRLPSGTVMAKLTDGWAAGRVTAFSLNKRRQQTFSNAGRIFGAQFGEMVAQQQHSSEYRFNRIVDLLEIND